MPKQAALVWTLRTAFAGRQFRGRSFIGGWAQNAQEVTDGLATTAAQNAGASWLNSLGGTLSTNVGPIALIQRHLPARTGKNGATLPERQPSMVPITAIVLRNNQWDTMRRRIRAIAR
jgi:hypothetical protein